MFVTFSTKHDALSMTVDDLVILDVSGAFSPTVLALQSPWTLRKLVLTVTSYVFVDTYTNAERRREDYVAHDELCGMSCPTGHPNTLLRPSTVSCLSSNST
jgi:hypothetical protein